MGGELFTTRSKGKTADVAFRKAVKQAHFDYGHAGYTGTIAEKPSFIEVKVPEGKDPEDYAEELCDGGDPRVDDKWGPCLCVKAKEKDEWIFFGVASS